MEAAGFVDMVNCVFADADDVIEKVDALLDDPDLLRSITDAGHDLVRARHTSADRRQIRDWYDLWAANGTPDGIVQDNPCGPLTRKGEARVRPQIVARRVPEDRQLLIEGWQAVSAGRYSAASRAFLRASNYHYLPEAEVGRTYVQLLSGQAEDAGKTIGELLEHNFRLHGSVEPDPVQWALNLRALVCAGRTADAADAAVRYPTLHHQELARIRWIVGHVEETSVPPPAGQSRASVSPLPPSSWSDWVGDLEAMLVRNGQLGIVTQLQGAKQEPDPADATPRVAVPALAAVAGDVPPRLTTVRRKIRDSAASLGRRLSNQPRDLARRIVTQDWLEAVADVGEREPIQSAFIVGPSPVSLREKALRRALARNPQLPAIVTLTGDVSSTPLRQRSSLVYLSRSTPLHAAMSSWLDEARIVLIDGGVREGLPSLLDRLTEQHFELGAHASGSSGYFVLRHELARDAWLRTVESEDPDPLHGSTPHRTMNEETP